MKKYLIILLAIVVVAGILRFLVFPTVAPIATGQNCNDPASGQVPGAAESRFLDRILEDSIRGDTAWLAQVSTPQALAQAKAIAPQMTRRYSITHREDDGNLYERQIRFENGVTILLTYNGLWTECPDLVVSDEEIAINLKLMAIQVLSPEDIQP